MSTEDSSQYADRFLDLFAALAAPFADGEVKIRSQANRQLHYITARTAMNRLDDVVGPANWWDRYIPGEKSVLCELTIRLPDGSTITKSDAGGYAGMADSGDDDKSGYSDAFKRACVKFGVARYLYRDGVARFAEGEHSESVGRARSGDGSEPQRQERRDDRHPDRQRQGRQEPRGQANGNGGHDQPPRTGRALFAFAKDAEERHKVGLIKYLQGFMQLQELPARMVDLDGDQVALVYAEAMRKLQPVIDRDTAPYEDALSN